MASACSEIGWETTLVSGPTMLNPPADVCCIHVESAIEMQEALTNEFPLCDILIMAAAVSDFRPKERVREKVKKDHLSMVIEMEPTPDILLRLSQSRREDQLLVGFAAETSQLEEHARAKLNAKGLNAIIANNVGVPTSGFASDSNSVVLLTDDGQRYERGPAPKTDLARELIAILQTRLKRI